MAAVILCAVIVAIYVAATLGLLAYGLNCYVMLTLFARKRRQALSARSEIFGRLGDVLKNPALPVVTTQIAVYNEINVVKRIMRAACAMAYPAGRHEIQVLDDSTDETTALAERVAEELRQEGHDIKVIHRSNRKGFKAGALQEGLEKARGEFVAVFDADFVPQKDFLISMVPFFMEDRRLGFAQARWGHLNDGASLLTRAQSIGIDGHFVIEQIARSWNDLYMNFNGTAGIWRLSAIEQAGGWQWDTLTEDLDLSYRVQFAGWKTLYLPDVVVPAELPEDVNAFRGQQFRWAKGSLQTLIKLFRPLMRLPVSRFKRAQALLHISGYLVHPMMLALALLALPILSLTANIRVVPWLCVLLSIPLCFSIVAPSTMYFVSQKATYRDWLKRIALLPLLILVGVGLALSNTRAILEAVFGRDSAFIRTPKRGGSKPIKHYKTPLPILALFEILLGIYGAWTLMEYTLAGKLAVVPFLAIYAGGFLFVGLLTLCHFLGLARSR
ncbi:MAG: glycosyltransferase [Verrucomicrobiota bacterium]|nr:glycosyltransferase [Verrucomicrobiota bacterium]